MAAAQHHSHNARQLRKHGSTSLNMFAKLVGRGWASSPAHRQLCTSRFKANLQQPCKLTTARATSSSLATAFVYSHARIKVETVQAGFHSKRRSAYRAFTRPCYVPTSGPRSLRDRRQSRIRITPDACSFARCRLLHLWADPHRLPSGNRAGKTFAFQILAAARSRGGGQARALTHDMALPGPEPHGEPSGLPAAPNAWSSSVP